MKPFFILVFVSIPFFLISCSEKTEPTLKINHPYYLTDFPDSVYVQSLDSVLAMEPVKKDTVKKTNIVLNSLDANEALLNTIQKESEKQERVKKTESKKEKQESFAERFSRILSLWESDPNNTSFYRTLVVKEGENTISVLERAYGKQVQNLPRFYVLNALQSLNPEISIENPVPGDKIRIPKL